MDNIGGYLGNANDGVGQGLAFVLPQSNTERYVMQLGQQQAQDLRQQALLKQKAQQQAEANYQKRLLAEKTPEFWGQAGKPIQQAWQSYLQDAATAHAAGRDPFTDPALIAKSNAIKLQAQQSKELHDNITKVAPLIANDHDNKFTDDSKQAADKWISDAYADPSKFLGQQPPQLQGTPSDIAAFNKLIGEQSIVNSDGKYKTTTANVPGIVDQARVLQHSPKFRNLATTYGANPDLLDAGVTMDPKSGRPMYFTNPVATGHLADEALAQPTDPKNIAVMQAADTTPDDPFVKEKLQTWFAKQNGAQGKFMTDVINANSPKTTGRIREYGDERNQMALERLSMAQERLGMAEDKANGSGGTPAEPVNMNIPYMGGKANVNASNYVPISVPNKNFAGVPAYSLNGGKQVKALESSGDYSVVGVGNFPFINNKYQNTGTVAQPDFAVKHPDGVEQRPMVHVQKKSEDGFEDFLIPYNKLPENIKNSKPIKQALSNFIPAGSNTQPTQAQPATTTFDVNGTQYNIPADKQASFLKSFPNAKNLSSGKKHASDYNLH